MKGRRFSAKRGHYIKKDKVEEALNDKFGSYTVEDGTYIVKDFLAFKRIEVQIIDNGNRKNELTLSTESDMEKADKAIESKRALNEFLYEVTGYTAKERMKKMKDKVEG